MKSQQQLKTIFQKKIKQKLLNFWSHQQLQLYHMYVQHEPQHSEGQDKTK